MKPHETHSNPGSRQVLLEHQTPLQWVSATGCRSSVVLARCTVIGIGWDGLRWENWLSWMFSWSKLNPSLIWVVHRSHTGLTLSALSAGPRLCQSYSLMARYCFTWITRSAELWCKSVWWFKNTLNCRVTSHELFTLQWKLFSEVCIVMEKWRHLLLQNRLPFGTLRCSTTFDIKSAEELVHTCTSDPATGGPLLTWQVTSTGPCILNNLTHEGSEMSCWCLLHGPW